MLAVARAGAGTNNIPVARLSRRGIPVFNAPGANANAVKELVLAGLLIAARNLVPAVQYVAGLHGDDGALSKRIEDEKKRFAGIELPRRTLGIVGLGAIGSLVADTAIKLGMNVVMDDATAGLITSEEARELIDAVNDAKLDLTASTSEAEVKAALVALLTK